MRKRKFLSLVLSVILLFSFISFSIPQDVYASDSVAYVYIVSYSQTAGSSAGGLGGHSFLVVKNLTSDTITVGHYNLGGEHIMSIGSWGNISDGAYAYYNIEKYRMVNDIWSYTPSVYVRAAVSQSQLDKLSTAINNNYTWTSTLNCSRFARYCWNSMFSSSSSYHIDASSTIETPVQIYNKIQARSDCRSNFEFGSTRTCVMDNVYVHTSTSKAHLSNAAKSDVMMQ